jgi:hypothetical protein
MPFDQMGSATPWLLPGPDRFGGPGLMLRLEP